MKERENGQAGMRTGGNLRQKIEDAAACLFAQKGYDGTSIEDISRAAFCAKGSVYTYFKSKEEIFKAVSLSGIHKLWSRALSALSSGADAAKKRLLWVGSIVDMFDRYFDLCALIMSAAANGIDRKIISELQAEKDKYIDMQADYFLGEPAVTQRDKERCVLLINGILGFCFEYTRAAKSMGIAPSETVEDISRAVSGMIG